MALLNHDSKGIPKKAGRVKERESSLASSLFSPATPQEVKRGRSSKISARRFLESVCSKKKRRRSPDDSHLLSPSPPSQPPFELASPEAENKTKKEAIDVEEVGVQEEVGVEDAQEAMDVNVGQEGVDTERVVAKERSVKELHPQMGIPLFAFPKSVKRNIYALMNLQIKHKYYEVDFAKDAHQLEVKYQKILEPLYQRRADIVSGAVVPTDEECDFKIENEKDLEITSDLESGEGEIDNQEIKGIPEFWLTVFKNVPEIAPMIQECDVPILKHLTHVNAKTSFENMNFTLEFHFEPNDYFFNKVLTKHYEMKCSLDENEVFIFEGTELVKCKGCQIDWKKGKNITIQKETLEKIGFVRSAIKTVKKSSFFNFFSPQMAPEDEEDGKTRSLIMHQDLAVGKVIKDEAIPKAVLLYSDEYVVDDCDKVENEEEYDGNEYEDNDEEKEN